MWNSFIENTSILLMGNEDLSSSSAAAINTVWSSSLNSLAAAAATTSATTTTTSLFMLHNDSDNDFFYNCSTNSNNSNCTSEGGGGVEYDYCSGDMTGDGSSTEDDYLYLIWMSAATAVWCHVWKYQAPSATTTTWFFSSHANYYGWCLACFLISLHILSVAIAKVMSCYQFVCAWNLINRTNFHNQGSDDDWEELLHQMEQEDYDVFTESSDFTLSLSSQGLHQQPRQVVLAKRRLIEQSLTTFSYNDEHLFEQHPSSRLYGDSTSANEDRNNNNTTKYSSSNHAPASSSSSFIHSCPICLVDFVKMDWVSRGQSCHHMFHQDCIMEWLGRGGMLESRSCPCCRQDMLSLMNNALPPTTTINNTTSLISVPTTTTATHTFPGNEIFSPNEQEDDNDDDAFSPRLQEEEDYSEVDQRPVPSTSRNVVTLPSQDYWRLVLEYFVGGQPTRA